MKTEGPDELMDDEVSPADDAAVMESFLDGTPLDPEIGKRVRARGRRIREEHTVLKTVEYPIDLDGEAVLESFQSGAPLDPEIARHIDERADQITEGLRRKFGTLNVTADLLREVRDSE